MKAIDKVIARGRKVTQKNIAIELGLSEIAGTVSYVLDHHPEIRAAYPGILRPKKKSPRRGTT